MCSGKRKMLSVLSRAWYKEKIQSVHEDWDLRPSDSALLCSITEPPRLHQGWSPLRSSYLTRVLHTARISVVDSLMFVNIIRKMVCFDLGKENMKRIFRENMRGDSMKNRTSDLRIPRCDTPIHYRVIWELRNLHCSPQSHCGSVVEHRSAKSEGLRLDSSWEIIIFFLCPKTKNGFPHQRYARSRLPLNYRFSPSHPAVWFTLHDDFFSLITNKNVPTAEGRETQMFE